MSITLPDSARKVLQNKAYGHLVTYNKSGSVQLTMVWVDVDGNDVLVNSEEKRLKVRNAARDPRVILSVQDPDDLQGNLIIHGSATVETEGADAHIDKLAKRYLGVEAYPYHLPDDTRVIVRITPERIGGATGAGAAWA